MHMSMAPALQSHSIINTFTFWVSDDFAPGIEELTRLTRLNLREKHH